MATLSTSRQAGFGRVPVLVIVAALLVTAIGAGVVYKRNNTTNSAATTHVSNQLAQQPIATPSQQQAEAKQYEGMTKYTNTKYGISFYHPSEWRVEERDPQLTVDPEKTQLSLWLVDTAAKERAEAVILTVVDRNLTSVIEGLDDEISSHHGDPSKYKKESTLKSKRAAQYTIQQAENVNRERYYFAVGSKTYSVETIYEATNIIRNPGYMKQFNKLVDSLELP